MNRVVTVRSPADLGAAIALARKQRGLSQEQLAATAGVERSYLARLESGKSVLLVERALRLLRRLGAEVTVTLPEPEDPR